MAITQQQSDDIIDSILFNVINTEIVQNNVNKKESLKDFKVTEVSKTHVQLMYISNYVVKVVDVNIKILDTEFKEI